MNKARLTTLILVMTLATLGSAAFAQATKSHDVNVTVPNLIGLRFTLGNSTNDVGSPTNVDFTMTAATYDVGSFAPTNLASQNWDDIKVFYNGTTTWNVLVNVTGATTGFDWSKVAVTPSDSGTNAFDLTAVNDQIVTGTGKTSGWLSIGVGPADYEVTFDGSETPGAYAATVEYTMATY